MKLRSVLIPGTLLAFVLVGGARPPGAEAQLRLTQDEALELAFPDADVERRTAYLGETDLERARELAGPGVELERRVVTYYRASREGEPVGVAYFDAHRVRTLPEVVMIVVDPDDRIARIEILKFSEPPEYMAPEGWIEQLEGRTLSQELSLKGDIVNMTGATLTSEAVTDAARRVLAYHAVVEPFASRAGAP